MGVRLDKLPDNVDELKVIVGELQSRYTKLQDQYSLLKKLIFGSKSEKLTLEDNSQTYLFNEAEQTVESSPPEATRTKVKGHSRRKKKRKNTISESLPRTEIICDIDEKDKLCACGTIKKCIGHDTLDEIEIIPTKIEIVRYKKLKYACKNCEGTSEEGKPAVITGKSPLKLLAGTMVTASLLVEFLMNKFCYGLPFYRQCKMFEYLGIKFNRGTICSWVISAYLKMKLFDLLLRKEVTMGKLLGIDETRVQVLKENGKTPQSLSYMWTFVGGIRGSPIVYYEYSPSRSSKILDDYLENYSGVVLTDDFSGYEYARKKYSFSHALCNAHARRKFTEALDIKQGTAVNKDAEFYLNLYQQLYKIESQCREENYLPDRIHQVRQKNSKKIMDEMKVWLDEKVKTVVPSSLLGKAIKYSLKNWKKLTLYLDSGIIPIDNNFVENKIRPFVIGRKNWLFSDTVMGAKASAFFYSLIESAKACGLNPRNYLKYLFDNFPHAKTEDDLRKLLPGNLTNEMIS